MGLLEFHRQHIDVQCLLRGEELIGYLPAAPQLVPEQDFLDIRDIAFVATQPNETKLILTPGMYAVFFLTITPPLSQCSSRSADKESRH